MSFKGEPPRLIERLRSMDGHESWIGQIAWSEKTNIIASPSGDYSIRLWDPDTGDLLALLKDKDWPAHKAGVVSVAFDPSGTRLASGSADKTVKLWNVESGEVLYTLKQHSDRVWCVAFSPDGKQLASCSRDSTVCIWNTDSGLLERTIDAHEAAVHSVAFDQTGSRMVTSGADELIKLWDVNTAKVLKTFEGHRQPSWCAAFDPKGKILATASRDGYAIKLWEIHTGNLLRTLEGHTDLIICLAYSSQMGILASKSFDGTVRIWRTDIGDCIAVISQPTNTAWISGIVFDPQQPRLAMVGSSAKPSSPIVKSSSFLDRSSSTFDRLVELYRLDLDALLKQSAVPTVIYTSAKVVVIGESTVGKSYLAHRIVTGSAPKDGSIKSTHGMKFWALDPQKLSAPAACPEGHRRDIILWDMGGQDEYRLIHQLFLRDTTIALVLLDPTRGAVAFNEIEVWNKYLDKQLRGRKAIKLLVGTKLEQPSDTIDRKRLDALRAQCGFADYIETSALNGRGVSSLCDALTKAIDWSTLGTTSRPELFQRIRDEIEARQKRGEVVLPVSQLQLASVDLDAELRQTVEGIVDDLIKAGFVTPTRDQLHLRKEPVLLRTEGGQTGRAADLLERTYSELCRRYSLDQKKFTLPQLCSAVIAKEVGAVIEQLGAQGTIARSRVSSGELVLVLQVQEVERYAGSLILAARNNPRGVPALDLRTLVGSDFILPGIGDAERLPREHEKPVIECTVQLMLEHGICFEHEGLLVFPTLFATGSTMEASELPHAVSLYYDFAGAIDNIYASLVAWLVLAQNFGKVRLSAAKAEFEVKDGGLCGLQKIGRTGGFAHLDVYFDEATPENRRNEFISFVEDHLARNGVEIQEHVAITCPCGNQLNEETIRQRIARGDKDVVCPVCEKRHNLTEGATEARTRDPKIARETWALRTQVEKLRDQVTKRTVELLETKQIKDLTRPIRLLHLSDLHFDSRTPVQARLQWLLDDIKQPNGLDFDELDYLVISGDFTDRGCVEGFDKAYEFVSGLTKEFGLSAERCIFVPVNHDIAEDQDAYTWRRKSDGLNPDDYVKQGDIFLVKNPDRYHLRFKQFSDLFYHRFLQKAFPLTYPEQGIATPFFETGIQFITLNSSWQIDEFNRKRSGLFPDAVARALKEAQAQEASARASGQLRVDQSLLRIGIWHHAVSGLEQIAQTDLLTNLQKNSIGLVLHGDVHEMRRDRFCYHHGKTMHIVGAGSFGARAEQLPESTPRLYNVIEIARNLKTARVHTREQRRPDAAWDGWHEWDAPKGQGRVPYYDLKLSLLNTSLH